MLQGLAIIGRTWAGVSAVSPSSPAPSAIFAIRILEIGPEIQDAAAFISIPQKLAIILENDDLHRARSIAEVRARRP